jgi:hypothetical protein
MILMIAWENEGMFMLRALQGQTQQVRLLLILKLGWGLGDRKS